MSLRDLSLVMDSDHASKKIWSALRCGISPFSLNLSQGQAGALRALDPDQQLEKLLREDAVESLGKSESIEENGNSEFSEAPRTQKYLLRLHDGLAVESVLIPLQSRSPAKTATTACISSQVGCAQGCRFCRTGDMGLLRNLSSEEILAQVVQGRRIARDLGLPEVRKVVFMGMGDPLANIPSVRTAVGALSDGLRMAIGRKRLQVSTIAPSPAKVMQVAGMRCGVVWSLHAANDALRSQLVPTAKHSILELRDAFMQLVKSGGGVTPDRRLLVAVVMIAGVNDDERHASELADFLRPMYEDPDVGIALNLIPYNPNPGQEDFGTSDYGTMLRFRELVNEELPLLGIHLRRTRGAAGSAACGQLATQSHRDLRDSRKKEGLWGKDWRLLILSMRGRGGPEDTWMILDGEMTQHFRAYRAARESVLEEFQADDADDDRDYNQERLFFFYKTDVEGTGTLFTPERLVSICEVEKTMLANNSLVKEPLLCFIALWIVDLLTLAFLAVPTGDSVLGLFYGTAANPAMQSVPAARTIAGYDWSCQKLSQSPEVLMWGLCPFIDALHMIPWKGPQFVDPNFRETKQTAYSRTFAELQVIRKEDEVKVMEPAFEKLGLAYGFLRSAFQGDEDRFVQSGDIRVRVTYTGINEIQKMALPDFGLSFISVILVFGVSWVHMKSSFMASAALLMMILTLPIASLFYQGLSA
eukprot:s637_g17.t1